MSDQKQLRQGDTPKTIRARAFTVDGFIDLTGYTGLTFRMVGPVTVEGAATGDAAGWLYFTFTGTELDAVGDYEATWHADVGPNGQPQTFPESTNLRVTIIAAI